MGLGSRVLGQGFKVLGLGFRAEYLLRRMVCSAGLMSSVSCAIGGRGREEDEDGVVGVEGVGRGWSRRWFVVCMGGSGNPTSERIHTHTCTCTYTHIYTYTYIDIVYRNSYAVSKDSSDWCFNKYQGQSH